jgi:hypothetical protein
MRAGFGTSLGKLFAARSPAAAADRFSNVVQQQLLTDSHTHAQHFTHRRNNTLLMHSLVLTKRLPQAFAVQDPPCCHPYLLRYQWGDIPSTEMG